MSTQHTAGRRVGVTPARGACLPPEPLRPSVGARLPGCSGPPASSRQAGNLGQGSLPIPAAQLPAILILAALRVIHFVDSETFLEVLGPDLGIQDLLSHGAGEPASLLVVQTLAKDPPCVGTGWEGQAVGVRLRAEPPSRPRSRGEGGAGAQPAFPEGTCLANHCRPRSDWVFSHKLGKHCPDTLLGNAVLGCHGASQIH